MKKLTGLFSLLLIIGLISAALPIPVASAAVDVAKPIQAAADWLISEQMESGGWGSSGMTALGTVGEIGKGLAEAYDRLDDADYLAALQAAGAYLMTKTDNFSPADGILAYELDSILGGKTYTEFVNTNYFDKLATDTYDAQIYDYSIPGYVLQENLGYSSYLPTLTDWLNSNDPALGLISAYLVGAETTPWSKAVKEKIETLDLMEDWSYLIVAKSIFSLSFVGEIFDPQIGPYASAANLSQIGEALAAYQLPSGAIPPELWTGNEEYVQTTAYAILAFNQIDSFTFKAKIEAAANYLLSVQNTAGYWEFWWSGNYVNTALSIWALNEAYPPAVACTTDCYVSPAGSDANLGNADSPFKTIQKGIESVADGGTVHVANGTYVESPNIYKSLSLIGESEAGVTIDARTFADYGMDVNGDFATTFQNFTLLGHPTSASAYGLKVSGDAASTTIDHVTVTGSWRSGIDLNGLNGGTVSNVTSRNSGYGVGLALTDCSNVAVSNVTTSGNAWGGMAVYTSDDSKTLYEHGSTGVSLSGTNNFGETNKLYIQTSPGFPVTNFTQIMFPYTVKNGEYLWFVSNLAEAGGLALGLPAPFVTANSSIELLSDGSQWVVNGMTIQAAIDAAAPGDTVHVLAGTYAEDLEIGKSLTLLGPNAVISPNTAVRAAEAVVKPANEAGISDTALLITAGNISVTVKGLTFDMDNTTDESDYFVESISKTGVTLNFEKNIFTNAPDTGPGNFVLTGAGAPSSLTIVDNFFYHNGVSNGITLWDSQRTVDIRDNVWKDNQGWAVNFNLVTGTISGNQVLDVEENGLEWYEEQAGFLFAEENHITFSGNTMDGLPNPYIRIYDATFKGTLDITGNVFKNAEDPENGVFKITSGADISGVKIEGNSILNNPLAVQNFAAGSLDVSPNYWGTPCAPTGIFGPATFAPWYVDSSMTTTTDDVASGNYTFATGMSTAEMNAVIACAAPYTTLTFDGTYPGGLIVPPDRQRLTFLLKDGAVIQGAAPCFAINASYTSILAESNGSPKCLPTGSANGINVASGLVNIVIDGLEIDGANQATGDGIHFNGVVSDIVLVDNYIHNMIGHGVFFGAQPVAQTEGAIDIHGNLFQNNTGNGIEAGSFIVPADYNSWGHVSGAAAGDGASDGVVTNPFTHVDLYLVSSVTPWANRVAIGQQITYAVKAHMVNVNAADFVLTYDPTLLSVTGIVPSADFDGLFIGDPPAEQALVDTSVAGQLHLKGFKLGGVVNGDVTLFSVTFNALAAGTSPLNFVETTDGFGMPGAGSSSNVYAAALTDGSVQIIGLPTINSDNIQGYYVTGIEQPFSVSLANPLNGGSYTGVLVDLQVTGADLADITSLYYWETALDPDAFAPWTLTPVAGNLIGSFGPPTTGFPMVAPYNATTPFLVTFANAGTYPVVLNLRDVATGTILATYTNTAVVYEKPEITSGDLAGPYLVGVPGDVTLTITNLGPMPGPFSLVFDLPAGTTIVYDGVTYACTTTCPPITVTLPLASNDLPFTFTFTAPYTGNIGVTLFDGLSRELDTLTVATGAYDAYTVTGSFSIESAPPDLMPFTVYYTGIPVTLTRTGTPPSASYTGPTTAPTGINIQFNNVMAGTYVVSTNMPRVLNISAELVPQKTLEVLADRSMTPLVLIRGNAVWIDDNIIDIYDASKVGKQFGQTGNLDGDVNFDGRVNIGDLSIVGGNFDKYSELNYASWTP